MKILDVVCTGIVIAGLVLVMGGCASLSTEQQERVNALVDENAKLSIKLADLTKQAKEGTATPEEITAAMQEVQASIERNRKEIADIHASGTSTSAILGGIAGALGRTALHAATKIPIGGPIGIVIQGILGLLLGGSETRKKEEAVAPAKAQ